MATRLFGNIKAGAASVTKPAYLRKTADGSADAGLVAAGLSAYYYRQGASATVGVTLADLAGLNTAYTSGGVKEVADGLYRVDWPDAAFLAGADFVLLVLKGGSTSVYAEEVAIEAHGADDVFGDRTGYALSASGLDAVTAAEPTGPTSGYNFRQLLRWLVMRFEIVDRTPNSLAVKTRAGATATNQAVSDDGAGTESTGVTS